MTIIIIFLIAIPVIFIAALFTHKGINTSAAIDINKPRQQVFDYLVQLKKPGKL